MELADVHDQLARLNRSRLVPALPNGSWRDDVKAEMQLRLLEGDAVEVERARIGERASQAPTDVDGFIAWYERL